MNPDFEIKKLAKARKWQELIELYTNHADDGYVSQWNMYWYARALEATGSKEKALETAKQLQRINPKMQANLKLLEYLEKGFAGGKLKTIKELLKNGNYAAALEIAEQTDIEQFGSEQKVLPGGQKIFSDRQMFVFYLHKACYKASAYDKYRVIFDKYKNENLGSLRKWTEYYYALSLAATGETDEALHQLFWQRKKYKDWFYNIQIAHLLKESNPRAALFFAVEAALYPKQKWYAKGKILMFVLEYLEKINKNNALTLAEFIIALDRENNDAVTKKAELLSLRFGINIEAVASSKKYISQVKKILHSLYGEKSVRGSVIRAGKNFGFVQYKEESLYFFNRDKKIYRSGEKVIFDIVWSYDFKKRKVVKNAVNVRIARRK